jgi:hypothetical protein
MRMRLGFEEWMDWSWEKMVELVAGSLLAGKDLRCCSLGDNAAGKPFLSVHLRKDDQELNLRI